MLIISHKNDIDGMGGVVLLKLAYKDVDYILCEDCNINQIFINAIKNGGLNNYKKIFVTDLHINDIVATIINNSNLKDKVIVFDHNESAKYLDKYDFANIIIQKETIANDRFIDFRMFNQSSFIGMNHDIQTQFLQFVMIT